MGEIAEERDGKMKKLFKKNKASEVGKVKPNEVVNSLGVKRKRGEDAGGLDSNDEPERLQMKRGQKRRPFYRTSRCLSEIGGKHKQNNEGSPSLA